MQLPDDLYEVLNARIDRLVEGREPGIEKMLELAATLGQEVDLGELQAASFEYGLKRTLADALSAVPAADGLADEGAGRLWRFAWDRGALDRRA